MTDVPTTRRLLIVDDNRELATTVAMVVTEFCPHFSMVDVAFDGRQGLALATSHAPDVIILDMEMPVMNGLDAAVAIKGALGRHPVKLIAISGSVSMLQMAESLGVFDHYCKKPVQLQWLLDRLD